MPLGAFAARARRAVASFAEDPAAPRAGGRLARVALDDLFLSCAYDAKAPTAVSQVVRRATLAALAVMGRAGDLVEASHLALGVLGDLELAAACDGRAGPLARYEGRSDLDRWLRGVLRATRRREDFAERAERRRARPKAPDGSPPPTTPVPVTPPEPCDLELAEYRAAMEDALDGDRDPRTPRLADASARTRRRHAVRLEQGLRHALKGLAPANAAERRVAYEVLQEHASRAAEGVADSRA